MGVTKRDLAEDAYGHTKSFDDMLKSLSSACSKPEKKIKSSKKGKKEKEEKSERKRSKKEKKSSKRESTKVSNFHRKKNIQNKNVASYSAAQLKEIFGV